jgi:branched-chain amino acid transport system permease protein
LTLPSTQRRRLDPVNLAVLAFALALLVFGLIHLQPGLFTQQAVNAITLGSLYALIAVGYTLVYGIIRLINFAHGEIFMVGVYATYYLSSRGSSLVPGQPLPWWAGMLGAMVITAALALVIERIAYRPLRTAPRLSILMTAIGISFLLQNTGQLLFGPRFRGFDVPTGLTQTTVIHLGEGQAVYAQGTTLLVPAVTLILMVLLALFIARTRLGRAMRATAQDTEAAQMMGVNVNRIIAATFVVGAILAAAGGTLWGMQYSTINPLMGLLPGIKAFIAAVVGGIGSIQGAVLGGFVLGFVEIFFIALFPDLSAFRDVFAFLVLVVILLVKPTGLIGEDIREKV